MMKLRQHAPKEPALTDREAAGRSSWGMDAGASRSESNHARWRPNAGFTLLEVILAIVIALGILVVLLYFYQQATHLRTQAIQQTERIAAARLLLDRLTSELRAASSESALSSGFIGTSNSIQFVKADVPTLMPYLGGPLGRSAFPVTDLKRVKYQLQREGETHVVGLLRTEEPLVSRPSAETFDEDFAEMETAAGPAVVPAVEEIRFLQFRYWGGTNWLDSWNGTDTPQGVEVSLGAEPVTNGLDLAEYPSDLFQRVIYLGAKGTNQQFLATAKPDSARTSSTEETP